MKGGGDLKQNKNKKTTQGPTKEKGKVRIAWSPVWCAMGKKTRINRCPYLRIL